MDDKEIIWRTNKGYKELITFTVVVFGSANISILVIHLFFFPVFEDGFTDEPFLDFLILLSSTFIILFSTMVLFIVVEKSKMPFKIGFTNDALYLNYPKKQTKILWKNVESIRESPKHERWKLPRDINIKNGDIISLDGVETKNKKEIKTRYLDWQEK
jgi:hypothetical protein